MRKVVASELKAFLTSTKRAEKAQAKLVMEKVVGASKTRLAARQHKENQRRKNALESSALPAKLADCRSSDNDRTELFIVEGDSALGTAKLARNSEFQALLPIRGKILNVQKASVSDMLKNAECAAIIQVIGAGSGRSFDLDAARYGKVIIMTDADVDGAHIRTLLLTFFYRNMPELIDGGYLYIAQPPLYRIQQGKDIRYFYNDAALGEYKKQKKGANLNVQRFKGLGEMNPEQLWETTMDPTVRTLLQVRAEDHTEADLMFTTLMGDQVEPRRKFIEDHALEVSNLDV